MSFLWKTLIIVAIALSAAYGIWDIYLAANYATQELDKYIVTKIEPNFLVPVFVHLTEKEPNITTKSDQIGAAN